MFGQEMLDVSSEKGKHDTQPQTTQQLKGDVFSMNNCFVLLNFVIDRNLISKNLKNL